MEAPYWPPFTTIPATETGSGTADHWTAHHGYFNTEIHPPNPSLSRFPCTKFQNPTLPLTEAPRRTVRALDGGRTDRAPESRDGVPFSARGASSSLEACQRVVRARVLLGSLQRVRVGGGDGWFRARGPSAELC